MHGKMSPKILDLTALQRQYCGPLSVETLARIDKSGEDAGNILGFLGKISKYGMCRMECHCWGSSGDRFHHSTLRIMEVKDMLATKSQEKLDTGGFSSSKDGVCNTNHGGENRYIATTPGSENFR